MFPIRSCVFDVAMAHADHLLTSRTHQGGVSCGESCKCVDCKNCGDGGAGRGGGSDGDMTATKPPRSSMTKAQRRVHHDSAQAVSVPALDLMREEHEMAKPGDMGRSSKKQQRRAVSDPHKRRSASTADDEEEQAVACPGGWADEMDPSCVVSAFPHVSERGRLKLDYHGQKLLFYRSDGFVHAVCPRAPCAHRMPVRSYRRSRWSCSRATSWLSC